MHRPNSQLVRIESKHGLWRGHGALLQNRTSVVGLLIVGAPKAGKSNVAYRIAKRSDWKLITGDHLEWTLEQECSALICGLRISNTLETFWWRDAQGNRLDDPNLRDSLEWGRVDQVVSVVRSESPQLLWERGITPRTHLDVLKGSFFKSVRSILRGKEGPRWLLLRRLLKGGRGRSCSWRSLASALSVSNTLRDNLLTVSMPKTLSSTVFDECADLILGHLPVAPPVVGPVARRIAELNQVYEDLYASDGATA